MARIKICGLMREEDISFINELAPDFAGFIISGGFRRSIEKEKAKRLTSQLDGSIKAVGVYVDEPIENIELDLFDIIQLHGNETPQYCSKIKKPVIKMLRPENFDKVGEYEDFVDYFLFDSGTGTGKTFDWKSIPKTKKPFFLAGGLSKENIEQAIKSVNPYAVDMSSSVETNGVKDYDKIKAAIEITRGAK